MSTFSSELAKSEFAIKTGLSQERINELRDFVKRARRLLQQPLDSIRRSPRRYSEYLRRVTSYGDFFEKNKLDLQKIIDSGELIGLESGLKRRRKKLIEYYKIVGSKPLKL